MKEQNRIKLKEGQVYAVPLPNGDYTVAQLYNQHIINSKQSEVTFSFFDYKFDTLEELTSVYEELDLSNPFAIATINSSPRRYGWKFLGDKEITTSCDHKAEIGTLGLYKNRSTDPLLFLEPYFGLFPWDGYYKENYVEEQLLPNAEIREDIKFLKDFTIEELKKLLPENSPKLIQLLKEETLNK